MQWVQSKKTKQKNAMGQISWIHYINVYLYVLGKKKNVNVHGQSLSTKPIVA